MARRTIGAGVGGGGGASARGAGGTGIVAAVGATICFCGAGAVVRTRRIAKLMATIAPARMSTNRNRAKRRVRLRLMVSRSSLRALSPAMSEWDASLGLRAPAEVFVAPSPSVTGRPTRRGAVLAKARTSSIDAVGSIAGGSNVALRTAGVEAGTGVWK